MAGNAMFSARQIEVEPDYMCIDDLECGTVWADITNDGWLVWVAEWDLHEKAPVGVYPQGEAFMVMLAIADALM